MFLLFHTEPYGEFALDLSSPYDRAVVLEILNIAELDTTLELTKFDYSESTSATAAYQPLKLVRFDQLRKDLSKGEQKEIRDLQAMEGVSKLSYDAIYDIAHKNCTLDPEVLVRADIEKTLRALKVLDLNTVIAEVLFTLDPMQLGKVQLSFDMAFWGV